MNSERIRTVTRAKGGTAERKVDISKIQVPDLWHIAQRMKEKKGYEAEAADMVLECWHLTHDLYKHVLALLEEGEES